MKGKVASPLNENIGSQSFSLWNLPDNPFHCGWERHFRGMTSRLAPLLYSWGRRLSSNSKSFYPSVRNIAIHLECDRTTVMRALAEMVKEGWAEVIHKEPGKPVTYCFVGHDEWAEKHPGQCIEKDRMPWEGEGEPLARRLYAISGGLAKFLPGQMNGLRRFGLADDTIATAFRTFLKENPQKGATWKMVYYRFRRHLVVGFPKKSTSDVARARGTDQSHKCDTPRRMDATPSGRTRAPQVIEVSREGGGHGNRAIPALHSQERSLG